MINIIFRNENFVVCDKPAEVLSVPAREAGDPRRCLGLELQKEFGVQVFPVHRLDFDVSGLIIYALNAKSHKQSQAWFQNKKIQKIYTALTGAQDFTHWPANLKTEREPLGLAPEKSFAWKTQMLRGKKRTYQSAQGEWAETKAVVKTVSQDEVQWSLYPITGKPHQLRFELSRRGFPIWGDSLYGSRVQWRQPGVALRAVELDLEKIENRMGLPDKITVPKWSL